MQFPHLVGALLILIVGYVIGVKWPQLANKVGISS